MNEIARMAYMQAMGIDCYVSRYQIPGAAQTNRLELVVSPETLMASNIPIANRSPLTTGSDAGSSAALQGLSQIVQAGAPIPNTTKRKESGVDPKPAPAVQANSLTHDTLRFSLAAIITGGVLWLEELQGHPLAREQVHLVSGISRALSLARKAATETRVDVSQFDWPIHRNAQLDLGMEAAKAGVGGFIGRKLDQHECRGIVLLGLGSRPWLPLEQWQHMPVLETASTRSMMANPDLKKQAWKQLRPLATQS